MAGALRKTMVYLGLAEDELYDEDYLDDEMDDGDSRRADQPRADSRPGGGQVTQLPTRSLSRVAAAPGPATPDLARITTIHPRTYNEAKTIGEAFRDGIPVIMNLTDLDDADAKRLVDFAAGLVFGLHGAIERVTSKVFLLSPAHVEIVAEEKEPVSSPGFFNQS
ncbi:MAG TPA: cell division protein SepF [Actinomycetales bacterium]|nr:cell division protein SepF [Actinomycetales bacterium]